MIFSKQARTSFLNELFGSGDVWCSEGEYFNFSLLVWKCN